MEKRDLYCENKGLLHIVFSDFWYGIYAFFLSSFEEANDPLV